MQFVLSRTMWAEHFDVLKIAESKQTLRASQAGWVAVCHAQELVESERTNSQTSDMQHLPLIPTHSNTLDNINTYQYTQQHQIHIKTIEL